jgi:hypothetical protein
MALVPCPGCGKDTSPEAESCPHCGYPVAKRRRQAERSKGCLILFVVIIGGCVLLSLMTPDRPPPLVTTGARLSLSEVIKISDHHWRRDEAGRAEHTLTITNKAPIRLKDLTLNFHYSSKTGARLGSKDETLYEFFERSKAHVVTIAHYSPAQARSVSVSLISAMTDSGELILGD